MIEPNKEEEEEENPLIVIEGIILVAGHYAKVLFDSGSMHFFITLFYVAS